MVSKYCPRCGRITSSNSVNYCAWGCGSLENEPTLPPYSEWNGDISGIIKKAHADWEKRQAETKQEAPKEEIGGGRYQMKLFLI